jgi:hypothetical protein
MAQTIPPARYAEQYAIYAQKYRGGKFTVTLKNVLVRGVDASGVPTQNSQHLQNVFLTLPKPV